MKVLQSEKTIEIFQCSPKIHTVKVLQRDQQKKYCKETNNRGSPKFSKWVNMRNSPKFSKVTTIDVLTNREKTVSKNKTIKVLQSSLKKKQ